MAKKKLIDTKAALPHEIFIRSAADTWFSSEEIDLTGEEVRYVRADLLCGECANRGLLGACPHYLGYPAVSTCKIDPACMKFYPEKRKAKK